MRVRNTRSFGWALLAAVLLGLPASAQVYAPESKPVSAAIVHVLPQFKDDNVGDIEVTLADGRTRIFASGGKNGRPLVSARGDVGWTVWNDLNPASAKVSHNSETLRVRLRDGRLRDFKPNSRFIMGWTFADNDTAVVIASMGYHGSDFYIKYDLVGRKVLGRVDEYVPDDQLPAWAKPVADN